MVLSKTVTLVTIFFSIVYSTDLSCGKYIMFINDSAWVMFTWTGVNIIMTSAVARPNFQLPLDTFINYLKRLMYQSRVASPALDPYAV